jgi:sialate O-acetylesterase
MGKILKFFFLSVPLISSLFVYPQIIVQKQLKLSGLFSDHMVLQQRSKVNFWGESDRGQKIKITSSWGGRVSATADAQGRWKVKLLTPKAGGPYIIDIKTAESDIEIKDVLIGEVWLASGQSNMDIPLKGWPPGDTIQNSAQEISKADYPDIRFLKVPFNTSATPLDSAGGKWIAASPETAGNFSATAYFYALKLHQQLRVPIGIVQSSIGGTPAEAWTSKDYLEKMGDFNEAIDRLKKRANKSPPDSNSPTVLFNAMISPLIPYTVKGVIWYQGESNVGRAEQYKRLFPLMIADWRTKWGRELPFYFVQIAPFLYSAADQKGQSQKLRDAQRYALKLPKTGMVTTLDIGYLKTAHPPYKKEVGYRLARFALANDYGQNLIASGPVYKKTIISGNKLIIKFRSVGSGLATSTQGLFNFEIAGADSVYFPAQAKIINNKIVVSRASIIHPMYVRYAWTDSSTATLFNKEGLAAGTFTSEK